jgi:hypothetical protein
MRCTVIGETRTLAAIARMLKTSSCNLLTVSSLTPISFGLLAEMINRSLAPLGLSPRTRYAEFGNGH